MLNCSRPFFELFYLGGKGKRAIFAVGTTPVSSIRTGRALPMTLPLKNKIKPSALWRFVMIDPISIISLITLAAQSVLTLTHLIKDYHGLEDTLQGLVSGLEALQEAIQALKGSASLGDEDFRKLSRLLSACTKRCDDLTQLIQKCSAHPHKNRQSIRDWLNYRFTANDISEFRCQIDDFKTTILIHMSVITM